MKVLVANITTGKVTEIEQEEETLTLDPQILDLMREETIVANIRLKYSISDEFKMINLGIQDNQNPEYLEYRAYVEQCKAY